jgi:hypothetical protein
MPRTRDEIATDIASIERKLTRGITRIADGTRMSQFDLAELRKRKVELEGELAFLDLSERSVRPVRRLLTYSTRGY